MLTDNYIWNKSSVNVIFLGCINSYALFATLKSTEEIKQMKHGPITADTNLQNAEQ